MLFALPLAVDAPPDRERATPVAWTLAAVLVAVFVASRLASTDAAHGSTWLPERLVRLVLRAEADLPRYTRASGLSTWWQAWTYAALHGGWWHLIVDLIVLVPSARAVERARGGAGLAIAVLLLAPLAAVPALLLDRPIGSEVGASGVVAGLAGLLWALRPGARLRAAAGYWLVFVIGVIRLRLAWAWVVAAFVLEETGRAAAHGDVRDALVAIAGLLAGLGLGILSQRGERGASERAAM